MSGEAKVGPNYRIEPYLETADMVAAYRSATVAIARSGGGLSEFAMFGLPSVLIPLPSSADDHQLYNAREFEDMQAATVMWQPDDTRTPAPPATAEALAAAVNAWVEDPQRRAVASHNLKEWDVPDATERIYDLVERAAKHLSPTA
jgi:UDP-N-acetylglucosamine--N-acetylmuramyl-(pentapeptide) pyrophosphoryl-undecaprenol N-acetylglucosamine transferase